MNEKLNMQDLIDLLTYKYNIPKKNVELFVKEFFDLVTYALENDKYLKIKGFGTFKLIDVGSRESINVNTGERFIIEGHSKISFTPDVSLKNSINKPFAHFETVILNDNIQFHNIENTDMSEEVVSLHDDSDTVFPSNESIEEFHKQDSFSQEDKTSVDAEVADFYLGKDSVAPEKDEHLKTLSVEEIIAQEIEKADLEYGKKYKSKQENGLSVNVKIRRVFICSVTFIAIVFLIYILYIFLNGNFNNRFPKKDFDSLIAGSVRIPIDSGFIHNDTVHLDSTNKQSVIINNKDDSIKKINKTTLESVDGTAAELNKLQKYTISGTLTDYKLNEGETLTKVALKFYGIKALWPYIVKYNRSIISDPDNVPYGVIIKIPKLTEK